MNDPIHNDSSAGSYLGGEDDPVTPRTMQRMRSEGWGPVFLKIGRKVRYRRSDLDAWLDAQKRRSTSEEVAA